MRRFSRHGWPFEAQKLALERSHLIEQLPFALTSL
jgi:hypothetical protein